MKKYLLFVSGGFLCTQTHASLSKTQNCKRTIYANDTRRRHPVAAFGFPELAATGVAQASSVLLTYCALVTYYDRPRGSLQVDAHSVEAKQSQVVGAGLGLYATQNMPEGTILGTYPGVLRLAHKYVSKYDKAPDAGVYAWRFSDNASIIDPTDADGALLDCCFGGTDDYPLSNFIHQNILGFWKVPTLLARINEPPIGGPGCNVRADENIDTRQVVFSISRDVYAGEELFMDYGWTYDRSRYGSKE